MLRIEDFECGEDSIELDVVFDTDICELLERIAALEAENVTMREALKSVLADAQSQSFDPGDCADWFDNLISCDSLRKVWLIFYPEDGQE